MIANRKIRASITRVFNQFSSLPDDRIDMILPSITASEYKKHDYFATEGEVQHNFGYIVSGAFRLYCINKEGKEYTQNFFCPNQLMAVYSSILKNEPSKYSVQALKDSVVLLMPYGDMLKLANSDMCWQVFIRKVTEYAYLEKEKRTSDLLFYDAKTRYYNFQNDFPHLEKLVKQHQIASFLGMSPETLSRIKKSKN